MLWILRDNISLIKEVEKFNYGKNEFRMETFHEEVGVK
jgi:hypothetical protein